MPDRANVLVGSIVGIALGPGALETGDDPNCHAS
jgi:hypothetical protein